MTDQTFADLAERLTRALVTGDFAPYRAVMALPLRIVPRGGAAYVLDSDAALEQDFGLYAQAIRAAGVTDIWREVLGAEPAPGGGQRLFLRVHLLTRAGRLTDPFGSEMLLVPGPQGLRIAEIISSPEHIDWTLGRGSLGQGRGLI